jgi:hypothetical protein
LKRKNEELQVYIERVKKGIHGDGVEAEELEMVEL